MSRPRYRSMGEDLVVTHSEYLGDITGTTAVFGVLRTLNINPGLQQVFPWLAGVASRYESFKFLKLNFRYMTESSTVQTGFVALIPDYDPNDQAPLTKVVAFQYDGAAKSAPWENLVQVNTPRNLSKRKDWFVRSGVTPSADKGLYDVGNLHVCVGGNSADNVNLGELWCDYEVHLSSPQVDSNNDPASQKFNGNAGLTTTLLLGSNPTFAFGNTQLFSYAVVGLTGVFTALVPCQVLAVLALGHNAVVGDIIWSASMTELNQLLGGTTSISYAIGNFQVGQTFHVESSGASTVTASNMRIALYTSTLA